ncbi:MAG: hypothetical protein M1820_009277 [Bogoriella megaspora]|nr:MAG: hypothetical protein M1820_009277 [Bogoriella megaspora]
MVFDDQPQTNISRWDNFIVQSSNPFDATSWSDPVHFNFTGYDTSPFWDTDGAVYVTGSHAYQLRPGIDQAPIDLSTGATGTYVNIWNGTGGLAPEGPHIYHKDDWYYVMIAEGGTGLNHEETIARSRNINGPYEADPANPILTNANTSAYFQTVGHADLFQDAAGNWWGVALSTRSGPAYQFYPMGRETVLTPVTWDEAAFPVFTPVSGQESGWPFPSTNTSLPGEGPFINAPDNITFPPGSSLPLHFVHWRIPITENYVVSPAEKPSTLRLTSSKLNLTGYDGNYAGPQGQTFVGRRQVDTLFTYSVDLDFTPEAEEQEAGVSVFLTQSHNIYFGVVLLPNSDDATELIPYFRLGTTTSIPVAAPIVTPVPAAWRNQTLRLYINAANATHYTFAAGLVDSTETQVVGYGQSAAVSYGFTGTLLGVYATTNGADGEFNAYVGNWKYEGQGQIRS